MKKRIALVVALVALVVSVIALLLVNDSKNDVQAAEMQRIIDGLKEFEGVVSWVDDGDTVRVKSHGVKITVRLWGIDTPEKKQPGGKAALYYLIKLVKRKKVSIVPLESGTYGRLIAKIYVKDKFINLEMLKAGHAWWYKRYSPDWSDGEKAQTKAQKEKRGIWGKKTPPVNPYIWRKKHRKSRRLTGFK